MIQNPFVQELIQNIAALCSPEKIYVFSMKYDLSQNVTGFKLCIVADTADKRKLERDIYLNLDCAVSYDVVLYTCEEWRDFSAAAEHSFARSIREKGVLVYDKTAE